MDRKYRQKLKKYYETGNEKEQEILKQELHSKYGTSERCFRCGNQLLKSDLEEYDYLCLTCDENMYAFETEN